MEAMTGCPGEPKTKMSEHIYPAINNQGLPDFSRSHGAPLERAQFEMCPSVTRGFSLACAFLLVLAAGCASKTPQQPPSRPREGMTEYRQLTTEAEQSMRAALSSLATVSAQSNQCPPAVLLAFSNEVDRVQVDSLRIRARSQAMLARGDAYFQSWHENLARIRDPAVRALAKQHHQALQDGFLRVKTLSLSGREAFQPFIAGLRKVRNALEKDPANISSDTTRADIAAARTSGEEVESSLAGIRRKLDTMIAMVTPPGNPSYPQETK